VSLNGNDVLAKLNFLERRTVAIEGCDINTVKGVGLGLGPNEEHTLFFVFLDVFRDN
jgi:hypothetical protein